MAHDSVGRTWIDGIKFTDMTPSSYGTGNVIIDSGILTSKPIEYERQANGLIENTESTRIPGVSGYVDISSVLAKLRPIREFKAHKHA